jgi:mannan endo-1,4-beta-mannosidase
MKSNKLLNICAIAIMSLFLVACGGGGGSDEPTQPTVTPTLSVASQSISEGSVVSTTTTSIVIGYSAAIALNTANSVTLNGAAVTPTVSNTALNIPLSLSDGVDYTLVIPANAVHRSDNASVYAPAVTIHFSTAAAAAGLVNANATAQALKVYQFLKDEYGKKTLSGAMANVNNNNYFSNWIYAVTGKHPALTCYDFVHLADSPANWIDYSDISPAKTQWTNNGLVAYMWHWRVPSNEGDAVSSYGFNAPGKGDNVTTFDIREALKDGTWQHTQIMNDIKKVAGYLKLLQDQNIPVIWRPLHEAAGSYKYGAWFWWGRYGTEYTKQLWILLYDQLVNVYHLNNLIWVWTMQVEDGYDNEMANAYPGNEYVDIVGTDIYATSTASQATVYNKIKQITGGKKLITLSECGMLLDPDKCFTGGDTWSWFMEWYTYDIASTATVDNFGNTTAHYKEVFTNSHIMNREDMPTTLK